MDNELWRWVWTGVALVMGLGEILTAGFFLLPFAIGAGLAAVAAWIGLSDVTQWILFFAGTGIVMLIVRRFMKRQSQDQKLRVGPGRYVGMEALALQKIDRVTNTGMIRVETEEWRATTDGDSIPEGATVEILEVRGTRLVVAQRG